LRNRNALLLDEWRWITKNGNIFRLFIWRAELAHIAQNNRFSLLAAGFAV